jgi:DNA-binding PadR family transcriptional regulator
MTLFERRVLEAVRGLASNAYGVSIRAALSTGLSNPFKGPSYGALYVALVRLEEQNLLTSYEGEATSERGGRRKRYYCITRWGEQALLEKKT